MTTGVPFVQVPAVGGSVVGWRLIAVRERQLLEAKAIVLALFSVWRIRVSILPGLCGSLCGGKNHLLSSTEHEVFQLGDG